MVVAVGITTDLQGWFAEFRCLLRATEGVRFVVGIGSAAFQAHEVHLAIGVVMMHRTAGRIDRQGLVVGAQAVAVGVGIREDAGLQHLVGAGADAGHEVARPHGHLLDRGKIVVGVAVQFHHAHLDQRVVGMGPDLGEVEGVVWRPFRVGFGHDLYVQRPARVVAMFDRTVEIFLVALAAASDDGLGLLVGEGTVTLPGLEVKLDPEAFSAGVPEAIGMAAVAVHETRAGGDATVTHQDGDLVQAFG